MVVQVWLESKDIFLILSKGHTISFFMGYTHKPRTYIHVHNRFVLFLGEKCYAINLFHIIYKIHNVVIKKLRERSINLLQKLYTYYTKRPTVSIHLKGCAVFNYTCTQHTHLSFIADFFKVFIPKIFQSGCCY